MHKATWRHISLTTSTPSLYEGGFLEGASALLKSPSPALQVLKPSLLSILAGAIPIFQEVLVMQANRGERGAPSSTVEGPCLGRVRLRTVDVGRQGVRGTTLIYCRESVPLPCVPSGIPRAVRPRVVVLRPYVAPPSSIHGACEAVAED